MTHRISRMFVALPLLLALVACGTPEVARGVNDPYEAENRQRYELIQNLDKRVLRPASQVYGTVLPPPVRQGVSNFASNLSLPSVVLNDILQGNVEDAVHNSVRFLVNTTVGIGGLFDVGTKNGLELRDTDFGGTLYTWGAKEGPYIVLPVLGPSTTRDTAGRFVDLFINPLSFLVTPPESYIRPAVNVGSLLGNRYRYSETIDSLLYDSADSYEQSRLLYLESSRFSLGSNSEDDVYDQYEDLYD